MPAAKKAVPRIPHRADLAQQPAARATVRAKAAKPKAARTASATQADKAPKADQMPKVEKADKAKKPKLVRDSFTIPKPEYAVLEELKLRAAKLGQPAKKSEVLRAGVKALAAMADAAFVTSIGAVPAVKTGRPAKS